jgi:hypothetical protein
MIVGPDGSVWDHNGLNGLASLTMSGVLTFADGSYWDSGGLDTTTSTVLNINGTTNFGPNTVINFSSTSTIKLPDGSTWTSAGLNLTKGLSFNGIPMGGVCGAGNFVTALSSTGVITCAVGGGGTGVTVSATAPVSPAIGQLWFDTVGVQTYIWYNDGTSSQWVPVNNNAGGASGSGTVTSVGLSGGTTGLTVSGSPVVTSGTMTLAGTLAIASGGTNATTAAAALTNLGAAPLASPSFTGTVNVAALTFNGIPMGGACIAGAFVQSISNSGVPTCGSNLGTSYAPLTNPAGGQNNYAPLASPVFTGTPSLPTGTTGVTQTAGTNNTTLATTAFVTAAGGNYAPLINPTNGQNNYAPLASPTFTGTITFPDGTTATTAGFNTMKALGIGGAVGAINSTDILDIVSNSATGGGVALQNTSGGANVIAGWNAGNGTYVTYVGTTGTGYVNPNVPANVGQLATNAVNGLEILSLDNVSTAPIKFWAMGAYQGQFRAGGLDIRSVASAGSDPIDIGDTVNGGLRIAMTNLSTGTGAQVGTFLTNDGGSVAGISLVGHGSTFGGPYPPDTAYFNNSGPGGLAFVASATSAGTSAGVKIFNGGGIETGDFFLQGNRIEGLALPGYGALIGTGDSIAGLAVGNSYLSATQFANLNISGAAYYNSATSQWVTDGGAGNGVALYQQAGYTTSFFTGPPLGSGVNVTWTRQFAINPSGVFISHAFNDGTTAVPTVTNGALMAGSRDTFGYINASAWPVTITFGHPFPGGVNSGCVMNAGAGVAGAIMNTNNQGNTSIQIQCVNYTGAACSPMWFQYVCFGVG